MADTRVQLEAEDWVRREFLPKALGGTFHRERVKLEPGGVFDCYAFGLITRRRWLDG